MKKCPYCAELIQDEAILCRYCHSDLLAAPIVTQAITDGVSTGTMKECPYCRRYNPEGAILCKYCCRDIRSLESMAQVPVQSQTPTETKVIVSGTTKENISLIHLLFSSGGRISRSTFWYYTLSIVALSFIVVLLDYILGTYDSIYGYGDFATFFSIFSFITGIFVWIKRSHDLNWSGGSILLLMVPIVGLIVLINYAFIKGTRGANYYGPNPCH